MYLSCSEKCVNYRSDASLEKYVLFVTDNLILETMFTYGFFRPTLAFLYYLDKWLVFVLEKLIFVLQWLGVIVHDRQPCSSFNISNPT